MIERGEIPKMGMSTVEVDIVAVNVAPGDRVESDSIVVEVQSEKANFEIEAGTAGIVKEVLVQEGDEAKVGDVVVKVEVMTLLQMWPQVDAPFAEALLGSSGVAGRTSSSPRRTSRSTRNVLPFAQEFPDRFFQVGMAEANMMGIAGAA